MTYIFLETGKPATSEAVFIKTLIENLGYNISSNKVEFVNGYKNLVNVIPTIKARCAEGGKVVIIFDADSLSREQWGIRDKEEGNRRGLRGK